MIIQAEGGGDMRIAIIGYGRMGRLIAQLAEDRGHTISMKINSDNAADIAAITPDNTDVALEFTHPQVAFHNINILLKNKVRVVSGTTGWLDKYHEVVEICHANETGFLYASNFSVGVNILFAVNKFLADKMKDLEEYKIQIKEIHHTGKKDAPSGTAITLQQGIISAVGAENFNKRSGEIISERVDPAPGTHEITYTSSIDCISLVHEAYSRDGFVLGAVIAAEWLDHKTGVFGMQDVLGGI